MAYTSTIRTDDKLHIFLCPNCSWRAEGYDLATLRREKDTHALYECPLPATQTRAS